MNESLQQKLREIINNPPAFTMEVDPIDAQIAAIDAAYKAEGYIQPGKTLPVMMTGQEFMERFERELVKVALRDTMQDPWIIGAAKRAAGISE